MKEGLKIKYSPDADAVVITVRAGRPAYCDETAPGVILHYNKKDELVEIELLDASELVSAKTIPKVVYDKRSDSLYIVLSKGFEEGFIELAPNVNLEIGEGGKIIGIEILKVSRLFKEEGIEALEFIKSRA